MIREYLNQYLNKRNILLSNLCQDISYQNAIEVSVTRIDTNSRNNEDGNLGDNRGFQFLSCYSIRSWYRICLVDK